MDSDQANSDLPQPAQPTPPAVPEQSGKNPFRTVLFISAVSICFIVLGFLGYQRYASQNKASQLKTPYSGKITIGYWGGWAGDLGLYLARDKGYFKETGLNVVLKKYDGGTPLLNDFVHGVLSGRADLSLDAINEAYQGLNHKVIVVIDYSNGADGIISSSSIKNFQQARGKRFAFEKGSLEEFFTLYALQQNNLSIHDIIPVDLDPEKAAEALTKGEVNVATTFEPSISQAIKQIHGNKLFTSADAPGVISDILTFRSDLINQHPEAVQAIVKAYFKGVQFWKEHPAEADILIGKEMGMSSNDAADALKGIAVLDQKDNSTAFTFAAGLQSIYGNLRQVGQFLKSQHTNSTKPIDTDSLVEPKFVKNLSTDQ